MNCLNVGSWKVSMIPESRSREVVEATWLLCMLH